MKTTLNLDDHLLWAAKKRAAERGTTLTRVVEEALRHSLELREAKKPFRLRWITAKAPLRPGADLSSRNSVYDLMDSDG